METGTTTLPLSVAIPVADQSLLAHIVTTSAVADKQMSYDRFASEAVQFALEMLSDGFDPNQSVRDNLRAKFALNRNQQVRLDGAIMGAEKVILDSEAILARMRVSLVRKPAD